MNQMMPYHVRIIVPIKERDDQFIRLQEVIEAKKQMLIDKQKKLRFITKQNRFLEAVKNDYQNYYRFFEQQKRDQIRALEVLDEYIKDLTVSGRLTKHNIEDAKAEQSRILREVKSIKNSLDALINDTQEDSSKKTDFTN
jgi:REP element-mobilizing transposase RayT